MPKTILLLDCARVYADPLAKALQDFGVRVIRVRTDEPLVKFKKLLPNVAGVAVSGTDFSPGTARTRLMTAKLRDAQKSVPFLRAAIAKQKPILGVCHGFQMLVALFGAELTRRIKPQEGVFETRILVADPLFYSLKNKFTAYKWRRWFVQKLPPEFVPLAVSADSIDAARHKKLPFVGVQFHPEIKKRSNRALPVLKNWLREI